MTFGAEAWILCWTVRVSASLESETWNGIATASSSSKQTSLSWQKYILAKILTIPSAPSLPVVSNDRLIAGAPGASARAPDIGINRTRPGGPDICAAVHELGAPGVK